MIVTSTGSSRPRPEIRLTPAPEPTPLERFWRDFGVNPAAMVRRAVEGKPAEGSPIPGGLPAHRLMVQEVSRELKALIAEVRAHGDLARVERRFTRIAGEFGVELRFSRGTPTVNWGRFPVLEVRHSGGPAGAHELVHVFQCVTGGAAALGSVAARRFAEQHGREPADAREVMSALARLSDADRQEAYRAYVKPMETCAYARFEESAFHVAGMFGKKSRDLAGYCTRLEQTVDAFSEGYLTATVPRIPCGTDARVYGSVAHLARTHGETALVVGAGGLAQYALMRAAFAIHPVLGALSMAPVGYLLYRTLAG
ncbi:MAG: hypothetical protein AB1758_13640 [Candidatus Eremiobacterota bacterium]